MPLCHSHIQVHCPTPHMCPLNFYKFRKYFETLANQDVYHFCSVCSASLSDNEMSCKKTICRRLKARTCDLVLLPVDDRLKQLYGELIGLSGWPTYIIIFLTIIEQHNYFRYPLERATNQDYIQDIYDGAVLKADPYGLLSESENVGLILNSDGVPTFKSSKGSMWPVYLMVTNIPPNLRTKVDNLIVAALWYGPVKPLMDTILQPILERISKYTSEGIPLQSGLLLRPKLLMAVFDLPAKSAATNTKQFNGEYGCFYCLDKGEVHNRARIYPSAAPHKLRTTESMQKWATRAEESGLLQYGVKGKSALADYVDYPQCIPIDYMHSILEGVFKQLMKRWFDTKFYDKPYSLRKSIKTIDKLVASIKPTDQIRRLPRSVDQVSFYKASEYQSWLIYYGLPILSSFLPPEYVHHLALLVSAMHILLSDKLRVVDLDIAHGMLCTFYQVAEDLYSPSICTANMHSLQHIVPLVRLWGPLWDYSMFGFENLNGYLGSMFHGTRKIVYQLSFQLQLLQTIPFKLCELAKTESPETQAYIDKLFNKNRTNMIRIHDHCYAVGQIESSVITSEQVLSSIHNSGIKIVSNNQPLSVQSFARLMLNNVMYHSTMYLRTVSRNNCMCSYRKADSSTGFGCIQSFHITSDVGFCLIAPFKVTEESPITQLRPPRHASIRDINCDVYLRSQVVQVTRGRNCSEFEAVPLSRLLKKCVFINIPFIDNQAIYLIPHPNYYEYH